jgi:hypothetical protein
VVAVNKGGTMVARLSLVVAIAVAGLAVGIPAAFGEGRLAGSPPPAVAVAYFHANEVATAARSGETDLSTYRDGPERAVLPSAPVQTTATSDSGRQIEWPQLGIGFGLGILLAVGLWLAMRVTKFRPLAH